MGELTRRGFVKNSAAAAAGMTAFGALASDPAEAHARTPVGSDPVIAYVRDPRSGEVSLMHGEHEVSIHDPQLAARIARAAQ
jgi:anaerobic selenocysteine-containing dehydrogenase